MHLSRLDQPTNCFTIRTTVKHGHRNHLLSTNPNTSMISDDEDPMNLTPIIGNPEQYTPEIPPRRNHPIQLCQHVQPIPDTPEFPTPENRGRSDDFYPDNIPLNNPPPYHRTSRRIAQPDTAPPSRNATNG